MAAIRAYAGEGTAMHNVMLLDRVYAKTVVNVRKSASPCATTGFPVAGPALGSAALAAGSEMLTTQCEFAGDWDMWMKLTCLSHSSLAFIWGAQALPLDSASTP